MEGPIDLSSKKKRSCFAVATPESINSETSGQTQKVPTEVKKITYKRFTNQEKKSILDEAERLGVAVICQKYGISSSTFYDWRKNKEKITKSCQNFGNSKRACKPSVQQLDEEVVTWLPGALRKGVPAAGPVMKEKALQINKHLGGPTKFRASDGWLHKFKKRQKIRTLKITGKFKQFFG